MDILSWKGGQSSLMYFQMVQLDTGLRSGHVALEGWSVLSDALSDGSVRHRFEEWTCCPGKVVSPL